MLTTEKNSTFHNRMRYFMTKKKMTNEYISSIIGVTKGAVTHWSNGKRFPKEEKHIVAIANILGVTILDLFPDSAEAKEKITIEELKNNFNNYIDYIPQIDIPPTLKKVLFNHGYPSTNKIVMENSMQNAEHIFIDKLMLSHEYQEAELRAVIMLGDAMSPYLEHGDVAIYYPTKQYSVKGKYVISSSDGLEIISIEKLKKCGSLVLRPENPTYSTETFSKKEQDIIEFVGLVIGRISKN